MTSRKLKFHEQKLLRKVDFINWKSENNIHVYSIIRKYRIQNAEDYHVYNKLSGHITSLSSKLSKLDPKDPFRQQRTDTLLNKLYDMGLISSKSSLALTEKIPASAFCRRRLPVVLVRLHFAESLEQATTYIEQGHIRIGPEVVTDPAFFVTRTLEDFITWTDTSKIRQKVLKYNDKLDDYDFL
eukprot:TRINITY_DN9751_c0_g1_i1.p1 TRINITY_DN9751_c0_g1~~TRINITY_DN9751_c0_g1_i1.p1  ORF type:complete len:203 (+),score=20.07 TRINITY_DN9751_c0_g1_i1:58-609(+)